MRQQFANLTDNGDGSLAFSSSYDPGLVAALKSQIPATGRRWDPERKVWLVDIQYGVTCADLAMRHLGVVISVPDTNKQIRPEVRTVKLEYLGQAKDRGDGTEIAFGYVDGGWNLAIPLPVLQTWFEVEAGRPDQARTLYQILGVRQTVSQDEIKSAYRRLARQWHPDMCHEPDAKEQFQAIQHSYSVLSDEISRRKYDTGLAFVSTVKEEIPRGGWRSPLRCGWLLCEGKSTLGRFVVSKILGWEDVTDSQGRVMVTSWQSGDDFFTVGWV